jgi:hypothetical protein
MAKSIRSSITRDVQARSKVRSFEGVLLRPEEWKPDGKEVYIHHQVTRGTKSNPIPFVFLGVL